MTRIHVYSDESCTDGQRYLLIGGVWVSQSGEARLRASIQNLRRTQNMSAEFKWTKVTDNKLAQYRQLIDAFFTEREAGFNCIVVDTSVLDYRRYFGGSRDDGFYEFYYQLISRKMLVGNDYFVVADERSSRSHAPLPSIVARCSSWWLERNPESDRQPVRYIRAADSKEEDLLQLADVLLGAVGQAWNRTGSRAAKLELIRYIQDRRGGQPLYQGSRRSDLRFNVWDWRPSTT